MWRANVIMKRLLITLGVVRGSLEDAGVQEMGEGGAHLGGCIVAARANKLKRKTRPNQ